MTQRSLRFAAGVICIVGAAWALVWGIGVPATLFPASADETKPDDKAKSKEKSKESEKSNPLDGLWSGSWGGGIVDGTVFQPVLADMHVQGDRMEVSGFRAAKRLAPRRMFPRRLCPRRLR